MEGSVLLHRKLAGGFVYSVFGIDGTDIVMVAMQHQNTTEVRCVSL